MWTSTKWTTDETSLSCVVRKGAQRKVIKFPLLKIVLVDMPLSLGNKEDCIELLSTMFSTDSVFHVHGNVYKILCSTDIPKVSLETFRQIKVLEPSIHSLIAEYQFRYHTTFNDEGQAQPEDESTPKYVPRICFWDLETAIPASKGFPNPNLNPIIAASFCTNYSPDIEIYTTLPQVYVRNTNAIHFATELEMLEHLFQQIMLNDIDIGYFTSGFDWPYLIKRLNLLGSKVFDKFDCKVKSAKRMTSYGTRTYETVESQLLDHVDLFDFAQVAYSHLERQRLEDVAQHLLGRGKVDFSYAEISRLSELPEVPTEELLALVGKFINYSAVDAQLVKDIWGLVSSVYSYIVQTTGVAYSEVGTSTEAQAYLMNFHPELLLGPQCFDSKASGRLHDPYIDRNLYKGVTMYSLCPIMIDAMKKSSDAVTQELGTHLESYPFIWTVKYLFTHPRLQPAKILEHGGIIGMTPTVVYATVKLPYEHLATYEYFVPVATGSWIAKNGDSFVYYGMSKSTHHPFPLARRGVELLIDAYINGVKVPNLRTYVAQIPDITTKDLTISVKISKFNVEKYRHLLDSQVYNDIVEGNTELVPVEYVHTTRGLVRVDRLTTHEVDLKFYSEELYRILQRIPKRCE